MHFECNVTKRVLTRKGLRYCPVVLSANGRIKPNWVYVATRIGKPLPELHPEGAYYIEWRENGRRRRLSIGNDAGDAMAQRLRKEAELNAKNHGVAVLAPEAKNGSRKLSTAIAEYLEEVKLSKKSKTHAAYELTLRYFQESCPKAYLEDIDRKDLLKFAAFLRDEKDQAPRSVYNKFENLMTFLKAQGIRGLVGKNDWPRFVEEEPEIYKKDELDALFAVCEPDERLWFEFSLMTGS
jgi:integrase/recombinase XerD